MRPNWYLYVETDEDLMPVRHETGMTTMPPCQHLGRLSLMYVVSDKALERTMQSLGVTVKTDENLKAAIAAYWTGIA